MKRNCDIYCEYFFWEYFYAQEYSIRISDRRKYRSWLDFYDFLTLNNLFFNVSKDEIDFESYGGKALQDLMQMKGGANVHFLADDFPNITKIGNADDDFLNSVFLTMRSTLECEELSMNYGVMVLNSELALSSNQLYDNAGVPFTNDNGMTWEFLNELCDRYPSIKCCNSLVIVDRYLLRNLDPTTYELNLKKILNALLPEKLEVGVIFTLCIVAETNSHTERQCQWLMSMIKGLRPNLKLYLNIFRTKKIHDRSIISNNILLTSGYGFITFNQDGNLIKPTTLSLTFPFLSSHKTDRDCYLEWVNNVLHETNQCAEYNVNYFGKKSAAHHLLDFYYQQPEIKQSTFTFNDDMRNKLMSALNLS